MKILLFSDAFPPFQSSASIQLKDLTESLTKADHEVHVFTTSQIINEDKSPINSHSITRIKNLRTKNVNFFFRGIAEMMIPITTLFSFFLSKKKKEKWDLIIWYSPTIFFGIPVLIIKKYLGCKSYLILRDIFPQWALDVGILKKGIIYSFFKIIERIQYRAADRIGIQSISNMGYFKNNFPKYLNKIEVLDNWLAPLAREDCRLDFVNDPFKDRFIFIYAGNIGSAQGLENVLKFALNLDEELFSFIFIGSGDQKEKLKDFVKQNNLSNIFFHDQIPHNQIFSLYRKCDLGIISLDLNHKTHNIPGKMLSYLQAGLPVFGLVNKYNEIIDINEKHYIGFVTEEEDPELIAKDFMENFKNLRSDKDLSKRCIKLFHDRFTPEAASKKITTVKNDSY